jgi:predicted nucleotidyltransferase
MPDEQSLTECTTRLFLQRIREHYDLSGAWLFGSRARQDVTVDSDADIAVLLKGAPGSRQAQRRRGDRIG